MTKLLTQEVFKDAPEWVKSVELDKQYFDIAVNRIVNN